MCLADTGGTEIQRDVVFDGCGGLAYDRGGRARRGVSGALYPQSASAGLNARPRVDLRSRSLCDVALKAWSCAAMPSQSRQVRKEAAVRWPHRVP